MIEIEKWKHSTKILVLETRVNVRYKLLCNTVVIDHKTKSKLWREVLQIRWLLGIHYPDMRLLTKLPLSDGDLSFPVNEIGTSFWERSMWE